MFDPRTGIAKHTRAFGILIALLIGVAMLLELLS